MTLERRRRGETEKNVMTLEKLEWWRGYIYTHGWFFENFCLHHHSLKFSTILSHSLPLLRLVTCYSTEYTFLFQTFTASRKPRPSSADFDSRAITNSACWEFQDNYHRFYDFNFIQAPTIISSCLSILSCSQPAVESGIGQTFDFLFYSTHLGSYYYYFLMTVNNDHTLKSWVMTIKCNTHGIVGRKT